MFSSLGRTSLRFQRMAFSKLRKVESIRCRRRKLSSSESNNKDESSLKETTKTLEWMGQQLSEGEVLASDLAKTLSPSVRQELSQISKTTSTAAGTVPEPPRSELRKVALNQCIPFLGFGFMDNSILIIAGDAIDTSLGVMLGISTMCAAALGNIISDVAGIALGTAIEDFCARLGLPTPNLTSAQRNLRSVRFASQFGCAVGIVVGCVVGMFPLLFIDQNKIQRLKQETHLTEVFYDFVKEAKELVGAQICNLYVIVDDDTSTMPSSKPGENRYFYGKYRHGSDGIYIPVGRGIISRAAMKGRPQNVFDVHNDPDFVPDLWDAVLPSKDIHNMLCVPVFDSQGKVVAVIQAMNKTSRGLARRNTIRNMNAFTKTDEQILKILASHVGVSLQAVHQEEVEFSLKDTIRILKEQGLAGIDDGVPRGGRRFKTITPESDPDKIA